MNSSLVAPLSILLLGSVSCFAQTTAATGIGTISPQQALHVAGASSTSAVGTTAVQLVKPTVRVDGLNSTNNTAHLAADGANSLRRVYANQSGDLVLMNGNIENLTATQQFGDVIPNTSVSTVILLGPSAEASLITQTFTLTDPSVVNFSASVSAQLSSLTDGTAKLYGAYFRFTSVPGGSGISTAGTANFGSNIKTYTNSSTGGVTGPYTISPRADLLLPAGTYTVGLYGYANGGTALSITVTFGVATSGENFIITASPTQFQ